MMILVIMMIRRKMAQVYFCHLDLDLDDRHRNPNINIREIIWLGD